MNHEAKPRGGCVPPRFRGGGDVNDNRPPQNFHILGGTWGGHVSQWVAKVGFTVLNNDVPTKKKFRPSAGFILSQIDHCHSLHATN